MEYSAQTPLSEKQEAHGPHRSPETPIQINKHIWLYHNSDYEKKVPIISFVRIEWLWFFIWTNLNPKFSWNWPRGSGNYVNVFSLFRNYLPLKKAWPFILNKFESPSPKNALCQVLLKLARWFWRRRWHCEKFTTTTTTTENGQIKIRKAHLP